MAQSTKRRFRISLDISGVDDTWRHQTLAGIVDVAATSPLIADPAVQATLTALTTLGVSLKADNDVVAADKTKMALHIEQEAHTRTAFDSALVTLKALVENKATKATDVASMGFEERGAPRAKGQLMPPEALDIKLASKVRGQFTASVRETGGDKWIYVAEQSPDPIGENTWSTLVGYRKTRKVTGPSGTRVWVRFARVRGQLQSEWGAPVLVTIP